MVLQKSFGDVMNVVGAVTAGAARLAAILAGVNLYVSGRRKMNKWTRETLVGIFVAFLDATVAGAWQLPAERSGAGTWLCGQAAGWMVTV